MRHAEYKFIQEFRRFRGCISKKTYATKDSALSSAMAKSKNPKQTPMMAYHCKLCEQWHVARKK